MPDLIEAIRTNAQDLPMMGQPWPEAWHKAAEAVRRLDERYMSAMAFQTRFRCMV